MKRLWRVCRKTIPTLLTLAVLAVFLMQKVDGSESLAAGGEPLLVKAWTESGATLNRAGVSGWTSLGKGYVSVEDLTETVLRTASKLGLEPSARDLKVTDQLSLHLVHYNGQLADGASVQIYAQSVALSLSSGKSDSESYLEVEIWNTSLENLEEYQSWVTGIVGLPEDSNQTLTLVGSIEGPYSDSCRRASIERVFSQLKAKEVEEMKDGSLLSISGYSPLLPQKIIVENRSINLQAAFTYDERKKETVLILASPVITMEY